MVNSLNKRDLALLFTNNVEFQRINKILHQNKQKL